MGVLFACMSMYHMYTVPTEKKSRKPKSGRQLCQPMPVISAGLDVRIVSLRLAQAIHKAGSPQVR